MREVLRSRSRFVGGVCTVAVVIAPVGLMVESSSAKRVGVPPMRSSIAILHGGAYGGIEVEVEPGQRVILERPLLTVGGTRVPAERYLYTGKVDRKGRAVFQMLVRPSSGG